MNLLNFCKENYFELVFHFFPSNKFLEVKTKQQQQPPPQKKTQIEYQKLF